MTITIIITVLVVRMLLMSMPAIKEWMQHYFVRLRQKMKRHKNTDIFYGSYLEVKAFYLQEFRKAPCISFVDNVDSAKNF